MCQGELEALGGRAVSGKIACGSAGSFVNPMRTCSCALFWLCSEKHAGFEHTAVRICLVRVGSFAWSCLPLMVTVPALEILMRVVAGEVC